MTRFGANNQEQKAISYNFAASYDTWGRLLTRTYPLFNKKLGSRLIQKILTVPSQIIENVAYAFDNAGII